MNRAVPPVASTVLAASVLLLGITCVGVSIKAETTWLGYAYGLEAVLLLAGVFPVLAREAVQDWRRYGRGGDE